MNNGTSWMLALAVMLGCASSALAAPKKTPDERFTKADANKDGKLSLDEFVGKRTAEKKSKAEKTFSKKDKDGDKSLTLEEFKAGNKKQS